MLCGYIFIYSLARSDLWAAIWNNFSIRYSNHSRIWTEDTGLVFQILASCLFINSLDQTNSYHCKLITVTSIVNVHISCVNVTSIGLSILCIFCLQSMMMWWYRALPICCEDSRSSSCRNLFSGWKKWWAGFSTSIYQHIVDYFDESKGIMTISFKLYFSSFNKFYVNIKKIISSCWINL